ncbi:hypothetical protein [Thermosynechococcus vestitus]|uniref:Tll1579 protein n=1 Tax=Thermosynechococcus vestitus (strain NIES-2133 / IAM M-273 / BP-1) TaxID=197221 RepID=Q8DIK5_THEVB|nr:hypothetical protein [Thermosynechococcus vestitus]BAC09131.1 tll1579 [Thermosynechococcus vestitus BP-1]
MASTLEEKLRTAFTPEQAHLLVEVIREAYDDVVRAKDFNELKSIVSDLGQAQKRTEERVGELAQAQKRTEERVEELAQAQKRTEERVEELAEAQKRTEERVEELAQAQKRTEERLEELAEAQKRTEERVEELAQAQKRTEERVDQLAVAVDRLSAAQERTERAVKQLARQVGGLSEALGGSLEDLALEVVPEILEYRWGMEIEFCDRDTLPLRNNREYEFDLVIRAQVEGRPVLVLGEVKSNITEAEVERFLNLMAQVEATEEIRPLFFGYRLERAAKDLIRERGAVMITTRGKYFPE